ncbi:MAG: hypothetical protein K9L75_03990, partial [Spirochaetia bacterium]|nr:hypothetical protein [Spirochaetia bacterium]
DFTGSFFDRTTYTVPENLTVNNDGSPAAFSKYHNLYANGMNQACRTAVERHLPEKRGFILTRAGYAGIQKYAALWTGDNHSWWEHLSSAVSMLMGISISGVPFVGTDVGGFQEDASPELFTRWFQFAVFTPFFRGHTANDTGSHEPWCFGETAESIIRHYGKLRYALLPYIYTQFYKAAQTGEPIMKPLFLDWPHDPRAAMQNETFLFGTSFLVRPVTKPDTLMQHVYLPEGLWYDFWTGKTIEGPQDRLIPAGISRLPTFIRGGSIIPHEAPRQSSQHRHHDLLKLDIYPDAQNKAAGILYMDEEEGFSYTEGVYSLVEFSYSKDSLHVAFKKYGFTPPWQYISVTVHSIIDDAYAADFDDPGFTADPKLANISTLPAFFAEKLPGCSEPRKIPFEEGDFSILPKNPANR